MSKFNISRDRLEKLISDLENKLTYIRLEFPYIQSDIICNFKDKNGLPPLAVSNKILDFTVDIKAQKVLDWKECYGIFDICSKPVDEGRYSFLDDKMNLICRQDGYVPNEIIPPEKGYGDYIQFKIDGFGNLSGWNREYDFRKFVTDNEMILLPEDLESVTECAVAKIKDMTDNMLFAIATNAWQKALNTFKTKYDYLERGIYIEKSRGERLYTGAFKKEDLEWFFEKNKHIEDAKLIRKLGVAFYFKHFQSSNFDKTWRFDVSLGIEMRQNTYYIPLINKELAYGEYISGDDIATIENYLTNKILEDYNSGSIKNGTTIYRYDNPRLI